MNSMIKISEAGSIAIHALALLATLEKNERISAKQIAKHYGISLNHLHKVMQTLVKGGLVEGSTGPSGGFKLARSAEKIKLLEVYTLIEGGISLKSCLLKKKFCMGEKCVFGALLKKINSEIFSYFENTTLADISPKKGELK